MELLARAIERAIRVAWESTSVVVLEGPRASGKTELSQLIAGRSNFYSLDDQATFDAATTSLRGWMESLPRGTVIDEAQRIARIPLEAKRIADASQATPGLLLLTGSHRIPKDGLGGSDPLAGRAIRLRLWPFSQGERSGAPRDVITELFDGQPNTWTVTASDQREMRKRIGYGGFPALLNVPETGVAPWTENYVSSLVGDSSHSSARNPRHVQRFFRWLCATSGTEQNITRFAESNELSKQTITAYLQELIDAFLIFEVPAFGTPDKREIRRPRVFVADPVFSASPINLLTRTEAVNEGEGRVFETFVACELQRLIDSSSTRATLQWWRTSKDVEVDFVLEHDDGRLIAIEVKAARESKTEHFKGINAFQKAYEKRFHRGFVFHCADNALRYQHDMWSLPFSVLWSVGEGVGEHKQHHAGPGLTALRIAAQRVEKRTTANKALHDQVSELVKDLAEPTISSVLESIRTLRKLPIEVTVKTDSYDTTLSALIDDRTVKVMRMSAEESNGTVQWWADGPLFETDKSGSSNSSSNDWKSDQLDPFDRLRHEQAMDNFLGWVAQRFDGVVDNWIAAVF
jgi:uncharacterized protein